MKKKLSITLLGLALLFVGIQFIHPAKNLSTAPPGANDIMVMYAPPPAVRQMLTVACYDCHSNNTRYPWYAEVQPVGWWLDSHVREARDNLNFSAFGAYTIKRQAKKLNACEDEVSNHGMPLWSYRLIHTDARLTPDQIKQLTDWFDTVGDAIGGNSGK